MPYGRSTWSTSWWLCGFDSLQAILACTSIDVVCYYGAHGRDVEVSYCDCFEQFASIFDLELLGQHIYSLQHQLRQLEVKQALKQLYE